MGEVDVPSPSDKIPRSRSRRRPSPSKEWKLEPADTRDERDELKIGRCHTNFDATVVVDPAGRNDVLPSDRVKVEAEDGLCTSIGFGGAALVPPFIPDDGFQDTA